jgi:large subunit ribosomal protein L16
MIRSNHMEASRIVVARKLRGAGKLWIKVFPCKPVTKKPAETRMGKGKGAVEYYVAVIKPGRILFEISGLDEQEAHEVLRQASHKLPIRTQVVVRFDLASGADGGSQGGGEQA